MDFGVFWGVFGVLYGGLVEEEVLVVGEIVDFWIFFVG